MASQTSSEIVVCGAAQLVAAPKASIAPVEWAGAPAKLARMDRLCALALVACDGALADGKLAPGGEAWLGDRTAVLLGTAFGCHATNEDFYRGVLAGNGASPRLFAYTLPSSPVGEISIHYGIRGPAAAVTSGLHAGVAALLAGVRELSSGRADRALVAAAEVGTPLLAKLTASDARDTAAAVLHDAAAAVLIERAEVAQRRGATVRAGLAGGASAYASGKPREAVVEAARRALADASLPASSIARVIAPPADAEALRALGLDVAPSIDLVAAAFAAAPLVALAQSLDGAPTLVAASDPDGGASCALFAAR